MSSKHNTEEAVQFLVKFRPGGPWLLNAIDPGGKWPALIGKTFTWDAQEEMFKWIKSFQGERNLYFTVNPLLVALDSKASRKHIKELAWLHVDIDPRAGEDLEEEKERALKLLSDPPFENVPKPTVIVFSGGGVQGFWKLDDPMEIDGQEHLYEQAKLYNKRLEEAFSADNCHNVDRIMRLPGTLNIPDAVKQKKGRTLSLAKLISFDEDRVYPLKNFKLATRTQAENSTIGFSGDTVEVSGNIAPILSIDDLADRCEGVIPDWTKDLIVNGYSPNDPRNPKRDLPSKYTSRSEALFAVVCTLMKMDVSKETIFATITDRKFKISQSVLDKRSGSDKYALRQIERAQEEIISPWLRRLNEKYAVVTSIGGKCRIISEEEEVINPQDGTSRAKIVRTTFADFANAHMHVSQNTGLKDKDGNSKFTPLGKWWLNHPRRRQYDRIIFVPNTEVKGAYNMWKGFACTAVEGDTTPFLSHVFDNICNKTPEHYEYLIRWMARCVQYPATQSETAIVLRGRSGVGKSFFARHFGSIWGRHYLPISNAKHLIGEFNAHLRDAVIVFADEAVVAEDSRGANSQLKAMITDDRLMITPKGVDSDSCQNYTHIIMASNEAWIVPTNERERRFLVLDVSDDKIQDSEYFKAIRDQMKNGGREALLYYLQNLDITDFQVRDIPITDALIEQKMYSFSPEEDWWFEKLQEGRLLFTDTGWRREIAKDSLFDDFFDTAGKNSKSRTAKRSRVGLGRFLGRSCPDMHAFQKRINEKTRVYCYRVPSLKDCRDAFDEKCGGPFKWTAVDDFEVQDDLYKEEPF